MSDLTIPADAEFRKFFAERVATIVASLEDAIAEDPAYALPPVLMIYQGDHVGVMPISLNTVEEKKRFSAMQSFITERIPAAEEGAVLLVTEVWLLEQAPSQPSPKGSFEHVPGRKECLLINGRRKVAAGMMELLFIGERDRASRKIINPRTIDTSDGTHRGRIVHSNPTER